MPAGTISIIEEIIPYFKTGFGKGGANARKRQKDVRRQREAEKTAGRISLKSASDPLRAVPLLRRRLLDHPVSDKSLSFFGSGALGFCFFIVHYSMAGRLFQRRGTGRYGKHSVFEGKYSAFGGMLLQADAE